MSSRKRSRDVVGRRAGRLHSDTRRDQRAPEASSEAVRRVMRANRAKDTLPERSLRSALRTAGLVGYRLNWRLAPGRPDIAYPGRSVAVFVHGCFWHHCPRCHPGLPKGHRAFWAAKFRANRIRDRRKRRELEASDWTVVEIWECEVRDNMLACVARVRAALEGRHGEA
jgi:DNA mismatch endonuclease, patch repair protein